MASNSTTPRDQSKGTARKVNRIIIACEEEDGSLYMREILIPIDKKKETVGTPPDSGDRNGEKS